MNRQNSSPNQPQYTQTLDIKYILNSQIMRCNAYAGSPHLFEPAVDALLNILPVSSRAVVKGQSDRYTDDGVQFVFKSYCGRRLGGTRNDPFVWDASHSDFGHASAPGFDVNRLEGDIDESDPNIKAIDEAGNVTLHDESQPVKRLLGEIDWDDPRIYTPYRKVRPPTVNYETLFEIILTEVENAGLSWDINKEAEVVVISEAAPRKKPGRSPK